MEDKEFANWLIKKMDKEKDTQDVKEFLQVLKDDPATFEASLNNSLRGISMNATLELGRVVLYDNTTAAYLVGCMQKHFFPNA
ncbi:MAG: hypothetical protein KBC44_00930 [Candidatus Pacebacteria bacterium]|nr:hypothetical protein [Candidatus Paceibacterota bacterium]MBP9839526.1 hypothetical protein [Candidatus Paceibacterota bacterium]